MPIRVQCTNPECRKALDCPDEDAGNTVQCPSCGTALQVPAAQEPPLETQTLGDFEIVRKLGEGGMGAVYEAVQVKLDRKVALKVLPEKFTSDPVFLERFQREAKAAAAINHPNIIQVYDIGEHEGTHFFAMEFVDGESVQDRLDRDGKLPVREALDIVQQVVEGLRRAQEQSIIHRDIKPDNIMLTSRGEAKLADLGLAKSTDAESGLTQTGSAMGTVYYMAPEQAEDASRADHRSDIYALGITLLHLVTGKRPYAEGSAFNIMFAHVEKPLPSAAELGTELPPPVESTIRKMCAKAPDERYQDYDSLLSALKEARKAARGKRKKTKDQKTETQDPRPKTQDERPEVKSQRPETGDQRPEARGQKSEVGGQKETTEDGGKAPRDARQKTRGKEESRDEGTGTRELREAPTIPQARGRRAARLREKQKRKSPLLMVAGIAAVLLLGVCVFWALRLGRGTALQSRDPSSGRSSDRQSGVGKKQRPKSVAVAEPKRGLPDFLSAAFEIPNGPKDQYDNPVRQGFDRDTGLPLEIRHKRTGMHFVFIPPGEFLMGSPDGEMGRDANREGPVHKVSLTKPFYLGKYEVTQAEWQAVMGDAPSGHQGERNPVEKVSWDDCQEFLKKLNAEVRSSPLRQAGGESGGADHYKLALPTEAQWEYACRAGTQTRLYLGDNNKELAHHAWLDVNSDGKTHPVGEKSPNAWGLYDMIGNVCEWCQDWYANYPHAPVSDPAGPKRSSRRALRGGSWDLSGTFCRSAARNLNVPGARVTHLGCRVSLRYFP